MQRYPNDPNLHNEGVQILATQPPSPRKPNFHHSLLFPTSQRFDFLVSLGSIDFSQGITTRFHEGPFPEYGQATGPTQHSENLGHSNSKSHYDPLT